MLPDYEEFCDELRKKSPHKIETTKKRHSNDERIALIVLIHNLQKAEKIYRHILIGKLQKQEKANERLFPEVKPLKKPVLDDFGLPTGKEVEEVKEYGI